MKKRNLILSICAVAVLVAGVICGFCAGRYVPPRSAVYAYNHLEETGYVTEVKEIEHGSTLVHFTRVGGGEFSFLLLPDTLVLTEQGTELSQISPGQRTRVHYQGVATEEREHIVCYTFSVEEMG